VLSLGVSAARQQAGGGAAVDVDGGRLVSWNHHSQTVDRQLVAGGHTGGEQHRAGLKHTWVRDARCLGAANLKHEIRALFEQADALRARGGVHANELRLRRSGRASVEDVEDHLTLLQANLETPHGGAPLVRLDGVDQGHGGQVGVCGLQVDRHAEVAHDVDARAIAIHL